MVSETILNHKTRSFATYIVAIALASYIVVVVCTMQAEAMSCDSCGSECSNACGTRHFRTCCFNYLRKRSSPPMMASNKYKKHYILDNNNLVEGGPEFGLWKDAEYVKVPMKLAEFERLASMAASDKLVEEQQPGEQHFVET